jgi:hypothetical protein
MSSTTKCVGEIYIFSNTGPHKVSYVFSRSQYGHHQWHNKHKTYWHFTVNTLCSSENSCHITYSRFVLLHDKQCILQTPRRKCPKESNLENEGAREGVHLFPSMIRELPVQKVTNTTGGVW